MRIFLLLLLSMCLAVPAQSASRSGGQASPSLTVGKIAAVVNGERITALDVERRAMPELARRGLNPNNPEQRAQIDAIYQQALDSQINDILVHQEALRLKMELPESEVDKEISRLMQQQKINPEELEKQLKQEGLDTQKLREQMRKNLLRQRLLTNMVARKVIVSKDDVAKYYEEHKASFTAISEVRMAIIAYSPDVNAGAIAQRIKSGKLSFEEAVRQYSIDLSTKKDNGAMPAAPWKAMSPEWRARLSAMKAGDVSDIFTLPHPKVPIKVQIKVLEKIGDDKALSLAEATPDIEAILREPLLQARFEEYTQWLRSRAIVQIKGR